MNYFEWSKEYSLAAENIEAVIDKLKLQRLSVDELGKKELNIKIAKYKQYYNECIDTANLLRCRFEGVG